MAAPPEKKESNTISMVFKEWFIGQKEQLSPVHRINGYPFRLRISRFGSASLVCEKSRESELWRCTVKVTMTSRYGSMRINTTFCSWDNRERSLLAYFSCGDTLTLTIETVEDGESWRRHPAIEPFDGALVIGEEKKKIRVHKQSLASASPYFDRLFFGNFKEKNMEEIPIGDVEYKEFNSIIKMVYGTSRAQLTKDNVFRVLELADRFELKIVEDRVISYLLSPYSFSLAEKNIPHLKELCLDTISTGGLRFVQNSPEFADFSDALKAEINDIYSHRPLISSIDLSDEEN